MGMNSRLMSVQMNLVQGVHLRPERGELSLHLRPEFGDLSLQPVESELASQTGAQ